LGGEVLEWTLNELQDLVEATHMGETDHTFKEFIGCLKSATGTYTTSVSNGVLGAHADVEFKNSKYTITCNIIVASIGKKVVVNDKVGYQYAWESSGEVVIA
jgi:hypothetical protein